MLTFFVSKLNWKGPYCARKDERRVNKRGHKKYKIRADQVIYDKVLIYLIYAYPDHLHLPTHASPCHKDKPSFNETTNSRC